MQCESKKSEPTHLNVDYENHFECEKKSVAKRPKTLLKVLATPTRALLIMLQYPRSR